MTGQRSGEAPTHLKEDLEHTTSLLVNQARDTLDTTTTGETTNGRLGDTSVCRVVSSSPGRSKTTRRQPRTGCCRGGSCDDAWRRPFRVPCRPFHVRS